jgi:hypothetical protein
MLAVRAGKGTWIPEALNQSRRGGDHEYGQTAERIPLQRHSWNCIQNQCYRCDHHASPDKALGRVLVAWIPLLVKGGDVPSDLDAHLRALIQNRVVVPLKPSNQRT